MPTLTYPATLTGGQPENVNDLNAILAAIQSVVNALDSANLANGAVTGDKLGATVAQQLGLTNVANLGRGASIIAGTSTLTSTTYATMPTTPDQVTGIVLPTNGLIAVMYQATWQQSVAVSANAAIFLGANQAKIAQTGVAAPVAQAAACGGAAAVDVPLATGPGGLFGSTFGATTAYTGDVTTGQLVGDAGIEAAAGGGGTGISAPLAPMGGPCYLFAAAGTYTVSVQFKSTSGSVTVKNRRLYVWTIGF